MLTFPDYNIKANVRLWGVASGEWRVGRGEWGGAGGEWRGASGEWRGASGECLVLRGEGAKGTGEIEEKKWLIWGFNHRFSLVMGVWASYVT